MANTMQEIIMGEIEARANRNGCRLIIHKDYNNTGKMAFLPQIKGVLTPARWLNFNFQTGTVSFSVPGSRPELTNPRGFATDIMVAGYIAGSDHLWSVESLVDAVEAYLAEAD